MVDHRSWRYWQEEAAINCAVELEQLIQPAATGGTAWWMIILVVAVEE